MEKNVGVSISTHSNRYTDVKRYDIIEQCFQSLVDINTDGVSINIVSDGITDRHEKLINKFPFHHIKRKSNGGISKAKNSGIDYILKQGNDFGFLIDDDVIFKDKEVFNEYVSTMINTGLPHYSLFLQDDGRNCTTRTINGYSIKETPWVNGCFLTFTRSLIEEIGYFKILSYKYGHEHSNFTRRSVYHKQIPFYCDLIGSTNLVTINDLSLKLNSLGDDKVDQILFNKNYTESMINLKEYSKLII